MDKTTAAAASNSVKRRVSKDAIEWMDDEDASQCIICDKEFGRIKNRRHHCRNCGRLVCGNCSSRKHVIRNGEQPRRVCDDCFHSFSKKQRVYTLM